MDVAAKAEALAQKALSQSAERQQRKADKELAERQARRQAIAENRAKVRQASPELADALQATVSAFGFSFIQVKNNDGSLIMEEIAPTHVVKQQQWDGKIRKLPDNKPWRR